MTMETATTDDSYIRVIPSPSIIRRRRRMQELTKPLTAGGSRATILALTTSSLGAGVFTMPYGFSQSGLLSGVFMLAMSGTVCAISLQILMASLEHFQCDSYSALARRTVSPVFGILVDAIVTFNGMALGAVFLIFLSDFVPDILISLFGPIAYFSTTAFRRFIIVSVVVLVFPLAVRKGYGALRNVTLVYVTSIILTIAVVAIKAPFLFSLLISRGTDSAGVPIHFSLWHFDWSSCRAFNICLFAFMQHQNAVPIAKEMTPGTRKHSTAVSTAAVVVEFCLYSVLGSAGYLSFLSTTRQNFINSYPKDDISIVLCRMLLSICLMFAIPMAMISTSSSLRRLLKKVKRRLFPVPFQHNHYEQLEDDSLSESSNNIAQSSSRLVAWITSETGRRIASVGVILSFDLTIAMITNEVAFLVSFIGGCFSVTLMCLLPTLIYINGIGKAHCRLRYFGTVILLMIFFTAGVISSVVIVRRHFGV